MSRGLIAYSTQQLSFILALAVAALTGAVLRCPHKAKTMKPILFYSEVFYPYVELLSWIIDPDLTKSFWYFVLSFSLPMISFYTGFCMGKWKLSFLLQLSNVLLKWAYRRRSQSTMVFEIKFDKPCKKNTTPKFDSNVDYADESEDIGDDDEQVNRLTEDLGKLELI